MSNEQDPKPHYSVSNEVMTKIFSFYEYNADKLEDLCLKGLEKEPKNNVYLFFYGCSLRNLNKMEQSENILKYLKKELEKDLQDPENLYLYNRLHGLYKPEGGFKYRKRSAEKGNMYSINDLGCDYLIGRECQKDIEKALELFIKSANLGNVMAQHNLGLYYYKVSPEGNEAKCFMYHKFAVENGYEKTLSNLGLCYARGVGVEIDLYKGIELLEMSKNNLYPLGEMNFNRLVKEPNTFQLGITLLKNRDFEKSLRVFKWINTKESLDIACDIPKIRFRVYNILYNVNDLYFRFEEMFY